MPPLRRHCNLLSPIKRFSRFNWSRLDSRDITSLNNCLLNLMNSKCTYNSKPALTNPGFLIYTSLCKFNKEKNTQKLRLPISQWVGIFSANVQMNKSVRNKASSKSSFDVCVDLFRATVKGGSIDIFFPGFVLVAVHTTVLRHQYTTGAYLHYNRLNTTRKDINMLLYSFIRR